MSNENDPIKRWYKNSSEESPPKKLTFVDWLDKWFPPYIFGLLIIGGIIVGSIIFAFVGVNESELIYESELAVESHLRWNADDAEFGNATVYDRDELDNLFEEDELGDTHYSVLGNVEATNGFGAKETVPYLVEFDENEEVIRVTIDDQEYEH